ncbi:MAG: bifunctional folylpolyglutamate synthase/dihydrofolate synthase [Nitrospira sp.]|nr:bifunctional folylpolyglutamate synthase/dihydrofolate synthase [Nitrospira sp.]
MTYLAAIDYLYGLQKHGIKLGLDTMRSLVRAIGNPERQLRVLHIGGTNGKGSTAAMAAAMLEAAGWQVGLYTSPHLVDFRERIKVNGRMIDEECLVELVDMIQNAVPPASTPTFFEVTTAMAFRYFADVGVDVAVVEVGLGGRFDATNVVEPMACAITTIGLDHEEYLGRTEEAIAYEKAGIIKSGVPVVMGKIGAGAARVIRDVAAQQGAPVWSLENDFGVREEEPNRFTYRGPRWTIEGLSCRLVGRHQWDNAACAIALLEAAGRSGFSIGEDAIRLGLRTVSWEGRLEMLDGEPPVLLDGAHNPAAAVALAGYLEQFRATHPDSRVILVWGMMRDKDRRAFIAPLLPHAAEIVLTQASLARSASVKELRETVTEWPNPVWEEPCPAEALRLAKRRAASRDLVCVTGSLMLLGDIKASLRGDGPSVLRG